jgi:hypothetical protein
MPADSIASSDFNRLESKVDNLATAIGQLVLIEERQSRHTDRLEKGEKRMEAIETLQRKVQGETDAEVRRVDRRIDKWLHLGMGGCFVITVGFEALKFIMKGQP